MLCRILDDWDTLSNRVDKSEDEDVDDDRDENGPFCGK